jgi:MoxR-like ATPase
MISVDESMLSDPVTRLRTEVTEPLKQRFVGRDEVLDLIALAVTAGEHLFLYGPPGTAKSILIRQFASAVQGGYFEYLLTRFSEPNEVFGPIDLIKLREGVVATVTTGMLPQAEFVFLDELFNANSAILNNLLTVLNERIYRRGIEIHRLPLLSLFAASNHLPEDDALQALFDRFALRCHVKSLERKEIPRLLVAGWEIERAAAIRSSVTSSDLREVSQRIYAVALDDVAGRFADLMIKIRDLGVALSDRRAVKLLKLVAASAVLCGRDVARVSDFWVLQYVWDREEQIAPLGALIAGTLEAAESNRDDHPRSRPADRIDAEDLARRLDSITAEMDERSLGLLRLARIREQLADISDGIAWLADDSIRRHLLDRTSALIRRID